MILHNLRRAIVRSFPKAERIRRRLVTVVDDAPQTPTHLWPLLFLGICSDCPIGGQDGSRPVCRRAALCDRECRVFSDALTAAHSHHPLGQPVPEPQESP